MGDARPQVSNHRHPCLERPTLLRRTSKRHRTSPCIHCVSDDKSSQVSFQEGRGSSDPDNLKGLLTLEHLQHADDLKASRRLERLQESGVPLPGVFVAFSEIVEDACASTREAMKYLPHQLAWSMHEERPSSTFDFI